MSNDNVGAWLGPGPLLKLPPSIRDATERHGRPLETHEIAVLFGDDPMLSDPRRRDSLPATNVELLLRPVLSARVVAGGSATSASEGLRSILGDLLPERSSAAYLAAISDALAGMPFHSPRSHPTDLGQFLGEVHSSVEMSVGVDRNGMSHVFGVPGRPVADALRAREIERVGRKAGDTRPLRERVLEDGFVHLALEFANIGSFQTLLDFTEAASTMEALRDRETRRRIAQGLRRIADLQARPRKEIRLDDLFEILLRHRLRGTLGLPDFHHVLQFIGWYVLHAPVQAEERVSKVAEELSIDDLARTSPIEWGPSRDSDLPVEAPTLPGGKAPDLEEAVVRDWAELLRDLGRRVAGIPSDPALVDDAAVRFSGLRMLIDEAEVAYGRFLLTLPVPVHERLSFLRTSVADVAHLSGDAAEDIRIPSEGFVLPSGMEAFGEACDEVADGMRVFRAAHDEEARQNARLPGTSLAGRGSISSLILEAIKLQTSTVAKIRQRVGDALALLVPPGSAESTDIEEIPSEPEEDHLAHDERVENPVAGDALLRSLIAERGLDGVDLDQVEGATRAMISFVRLLAGGAFRRLLRDDFDVSSVDAEADLSEILAVVREAGPEADPHLWRVLRHAILLKAGSGRGSGTAEAILRLAPSVQSFDVLRDAVAAQVFPQARPEAVAPPFDVTGQRAKNAQMIGMCLVEIRRIDAVDVDAVRAALLHEDALLPLIERSVVGERVDGELLDRARSTQDVRGASAYLDSLGASRGSIGDPARNRLCEAVLRVCSAYVRWSEGMQPIDHPGAGGIRSGRKELRTAFDREIAAIDEIRENGNGYEKVVLGRAHAIVLAHRERLLPRNGIPMFLLEDPRG